jgi:hypothetical protein
MLSKCGRHWLIKLQRMKLIQNFENYDSDVLVDADFTIMLCPDKGV